MISMLEKEDVWQKLKKTHKPIILYGMGNGADRIIDLFNEFGIKYSDIFASDEFVRGHFFHGKKVLTYSEVCEKYEDFIVVMTFGAHDKTTLGQIKEMSKQREFYSLTVPIAGDGLFTRRFVDEHLSEFEKVYHLLETDYDRKIFLNIINFKISGKVHYLFESFSDKKEIYDSILKIEKDDVIVDLGAYNGDTVEEFVLASNGEYKKIIALEPNKKNFQKLLVNTERFRDVIAYNFGAWDKNDTLFIKKASGRQSKLNDEGIPIEVVSVDELINEKISLLKMDIEGSEKNAIEGAKETIRKYHPKLYVCAYHRNEDLFALPLQIHEIDAGYKFYIRQHPYIPAWECNYYLV